MDRGTKRFLDELARSTKENEKKERKRQKKQKRLAKVETKVLIMAPECPEIGHTDWKSCSKKSDLPKLFSKIFVDFSNSARIQNFRFTAIVMWVNKRKLKFKYLIVDRGPMPKEGIIFL